VNRNPKYIIVKESASAHEFAIVFDPLLTHKDVARAYPICVSAGFVQIRHDGGVETFGESVSLRKPSRPDDWKIVDRAINPRNYY
jgi:hypothetical protein